MFLPAESGRLGTVHMSNFHTLMLHIQHQKYLSVCELHLALNAVISSDTIQQLVQVLILSPVEIREHLGWGKSCGNKKWGKKILISKYDLEHIFKHV